MIVENIRVTYLFRIKVNQNMLLHDEGNILEETQSREKWDNTSGS